MKKRIRNQSELKVYIQNARAIPQELKQEILSWEEIAHSPYSHSYYSNRKKRWNYTPIGCYRVSNHWNFKGKSKSGGQFVHSRTDIPVRNHTYWTLAVFTGKVWRVIKSLPMEKK
ncbi:MAG: hypothetical protein AAGI23_06995 [Bacteroidota bacterium]